MSEVDEYYANLLIMQYHNKQKARDTIKASTHAIPDELVTNVENGFNVDTAVGKQLDILGKYIGADRYYEDNGDILALDDEDYRTILKLAIISNSSDFSHKSIDDALYAFFEDRIRMDSDGNMEMEYFVPKDKTPLIRAALQKKILPKPMGVRVSGIIEYSKIFFGLCTYDNQTAVYKTGFRTYNDPDKAGETLTYDKRIDF